MPHAVPRLGLFLLLPLACAGAAGAEELAAGRRSEPTVAVWHEKLGDDTWSVAETTHFRIFHRTTAREAEKLARMAEQTRTAQLARWFGDRDAVWSSSCLIYIYPSADDYATATGVPRDAPGHTEITADGSRILGRRINLHGRADALIEGILPHEVTHAVIAGRFGFGPVPRWVDEGVAILAEPPELVERHLDYLRRRHEDLGLYSLAGVMRLQDYPDPASRGIFYAQSVSVVDFLTRHRGARTFTRFVQRGLREGYKEALQAEYGWTFAELERRWRRHTFRESRAATSVRGRPTWAAP